MLGVDIGSYAIKVAVVNKAAKGYFVDFFASLTLPSEMRGTAMINPVALRGYVSQLIQPIKKRPKSVAFSVPTSSAIFKTFEMDSDTDDELLEGEAQIQLLNVIPFTLDQVCIDFVRLPRQFNGDSSKQSVLAVACRNDMVYHRANALSDSFIKEKAVDIEAFSLGKVLSCIKGSQFYEYYAIIDIGYLSSSIQVFSDTHMMFNREIPMGGQHLTEAIVRTMAISNNEAEETKLRAFNRVPYSVVEGYFETLIEQVSLAIELLKSDHSEPISLFYITGGGANTPGLLAYFNQHLPGQTFRFLPLEHYLPFSHHLSGINRKTAAHSAAVAVGLSLRE
ncbi:MAG: hypothetical protein CSA44_00485 [Gammaproteobacteria bacterium]|nr:MAG: hypothetical protein CSA44_00485 [Gammaproteobacteria bacterium]